MRFGAFPLAAPFVAGAGTGAFVAGGSAFVGVAACSYCNKLGSSNIGPRLRKSPYSLFKNARVSASLIATPSSASSNVNTATVPSVLHAMSEYPSGDQHVSTTDCVNIVFTMHTGFGRFVAQTVILQS